MCFDVTVKTCKHNIHSSFKMLKVLLKKVDSVSNSPDPPAVKHHFSYTSVYEQKYKIINRINKSSIPKNLFSRIKFLKNKLILLQTLYNHLNH